MDKQQSSRALTEAGSAALRRGDAFGARQHFRQAADADGTNAVAWTGLAIACKALKDRPALHAALDRALAIQPRDLRGLLLKADDLAAQGDRRAALSFYKAVAGYYPDPSRLQSDSARELVRARQAIDTIGKAILDGMRHSLARQGYRPESASARFNRAMAMLSATAERYEQQPRAFFFPELPTIQFYDRSAFPWLQQLEAATHEISAEAQALMAEPHLFAPYIEADINRPVNRAHAMLDNPAWTAAYLWKHGDPVADIVARCPRTMAALDATPLEVIPKRSPFALFSKLTPGAWIKPHTGFLNTRLVCHLPLVVPDGCSLRVGDETRVWETGKALIFNDSIEHEARNAGKGTRIVLIFTIWRPELTEEERRLIAALMESVDAA